MDKKTLLELLDDPDVVAKVQEVTKIKREPITPADYKKIDRILNWWYEGSGGDRVEPTIFQKKDILKVLNSSGEGEVKVVLEQAFNSPLNYEGSMMSQYLTNIFWIMKPSNFAKVKAGNYDNAGNKPQTYRNSDNKISDINNKLLK